MLSVCFFGCLVVFSNSLRKWQSKSSENPVTSWLAVSTPLHLLEVIRLQTYSCFCLINRYMLNTYFIHHSQSQGEERKQFQCRMVDAV